MPEIQALKDPLVQQALLNVMVHDMLKERQSERRWKVIKRTLVLSLGLASVGYWVMIYVNSSGVSVNTAVGKRVGIVKINGDIMQTSLSSSEKIVPALRAAFEDPSVTSIVLAIDSPGGAPLEAERINTAMDMLKKKHGKPIYASIQNVGASAAYMIAMNTDKICAGRYSLVGSIGAVMSSWDVHKALNKYEIQQDVYASGQLKSMLNPFTAPTDAAKQKAQDLVNKAGGMFAAELQAKRGQLLKEDVKYDSGEIWDGDAALAIGLIDEICTLEKLVDSEGGQIKEFGPGAKTYTPFSFNFADDIAKAITQIFWRQRAGEAPLKF